MDDAVKFVANKAGLDEYDVRIVPEPKNFIEQILEATGGGKDDPKKLDAAARGVKAGGPSLVDLAAPYLKDLDPQRVRVIKTALRQLQTLHQEGVALMMPEFVVK
jgi:hypothetical protein